MSKAPLCSAVGGGGQPVSCPSGTFTKSTCLFQDRVGGGSPDKRLGLGLGVSDEAFNMGHQVFEAAKRQVQAGEKPAGVRQSGYFFVSQEDKQ